jgi:hypothetical protein
MPTTTVAVRPAKRSRSAKKVTRTRAMVKNIKRGMMRPSRNCHSFRRWGNPERWDVSGASGLGGMTFSLSDVLGYTEFENLYDRYMLTCVVLRFRLINNPDSSQYLNTNNHGYATPNVTNWFPRLFFCPDYDDNTAEAVAVLRERAKTKMRVLRPNQYFKIAVKPACTIQTYYTTTGAGYAPKWKQWIDMSQSGVPHYGLKWAVDTSGIDPNDTQPFKLEIEKQYYFKCKDVK